MGSDGVEGVGSIAVVGAGLCQILEEVITWFWGLIQIRQHGPSDNHHSQRQDAGGR